MRFSRVGFDFFFGKPIQLGKQKLRLRAERSIVRARRFLFNLMNLGLFLREHRANLIYEKV